MTENLLENLLPKLEEKMMLLLTELEDARRDIQRLSQENSILKNDRENYSKKLVDMLSLLDAVNTSNEIIAPNTPSAPALKPVLIQERSTG